MQIKCEQINKVVSQFYSFTKKQTEAALYPAVDAIVAMKGTKRNYEILASAQKALDAEVNYSADLNDPTIEIDETAAVTVSK